MTTPITNNQDLREFELEKILMGLWHYGYNVCNVEKNHKDGYDNYTFEIKPKQALKAIEALITQRQLDVLERVDPAESRAILICVNCHDEREVSLRNLPTEAKHFSKEHKQRIGKTWCNLEHLVVKSLSITEDTVGGKE